MKRIFPKLMWRPHISLYFNKMFLFKAVSLYVHHKLFLLSWPQKYATIITINLTTPKSMPRNFSQSKHKNRCFLLLNSILLFKKTKNFNNWNWKTLISMQILSKHFYNSLVLNVYHRFSLWFFPISLIVVGKITFESGQQVTCLTLGRREWWKRKQMEWRVGKYWKTI